jgi:hypothetical protein
MSNFINEYTEVNDVGFGGFEPLADRPDLYHGNGFTDRRQERNPMY